MMCSNLREMLKKLEKRKSFRAFVYIMHAKTSTIIVDDKVIAVKKGEQFSLIFDKDVEKIQVYRGKYSVFTSTSGFIFAGMKDENIEPIFEFTIRAAKGFNNRQINQFMNQFIEREVTFCSAHFDSIEWCKQFTDFTRKIREIKTVEKIVQANGVVNLIIQVKDNAHLVSLAKEYERIMENELDIRVPPMERKALIETGFAIDVDLAEFSIYR